MDYTKFFISQINTLIEIRIRSYVCDYSNGIKQKQTKMFFVRFLKDLNVDTFILLSTMNYYERVKMQIWGKKCIDVVINYVLYTTCLRVNKRIEALYSLTTCSVLPKGDFWIKNANDLIDIRCRYLIDRHSP